MKKWLVILTASVLCAASAFAYNPPYGGENVFKYSNPVMMSGAASGSGGPLFNVLPASITYNPALTALEQRVIANVSYTGLFDTNRVSEEDSVYGQAFQLGTVIPTKWVVFTGTVQGNFLSFPRMDTGNNIILHAGVAKDVTDRLCVGMNVYTGFYFGNGSDFTVGADLGALYLFDDMGFLKSPRLGVSLMNLGKPVSGNYSVTGINGTSEGISYPGIVTPRASFAGTLFDWRNFKGGFSADLYFPTFQDVGFDAGLSFAYSDMVQLNVAWEADLREILESGVNAINWPAVGLNVRFTINSSKLAGGNDDWSKSEVVPAVAWKNLYNGIQAISGSASIYLGMADTSAPEIYLWDETDDDISGEDFFGEEE